MILPTTALLMLATRVGSAAEAPGLDIDGKRTLHGLVPPGSSTRAVP